ncbi:hypothetical protein R1sor_005901 [Riccia sorocarpa]|uniref:Uncharacterized protein n=1 Tax=Riccia sorocarpa TaxID=122646 RepID=A0ABD3HKV7_9MARC
MNVHRRVGRILSHTMAALVGCTHQLVAASTFEVAAACRASSSTRASTASSVCCGPAGRRGAILKNSSYKSSVRVDSSSFRGLPLSIIERRNVGVRSAAVVSVRAESDHGADPEFNDGDYIVLGLAHCFIKDADQKLLDKFVIEPIPAGGLECMDNGGRTCYKHAHATTLGVALKQDISLLPPEFQVARFAEEFDFRTKCASRTWKRDHAREFLMKLVPTDGVRSDWNFSLEDKRVLNMENVVRDEDNIKQDISIDVYGRTPKEDEMSQEIAEMYNV